MGILVLTVGALLYAIPTFVIGIEQTRIAHDLGYFYARLKVPLNRWSFGCSLRIYRIRLVIIGGLIMFIDLMLKMFSKKQTKSIVGRLETIFPQFFKFLYPKIFLYLYKYKKLLCVHKHCRTKSRRAGKLYAGTTARREWIEINWETF